MLNISISASNSSCKDWKVINRIDTIELTDDDGNKLIVSIDDYNIRYIPHHRAKAFIINSFDILDKALGLKPITENELDELYGGMCNDYNNKDYLKDYVI